MASAVVTVDVTGSAASVQAPNISEATAVIGDESHGAGAATQAPNVSNATGSVSVEGSAASTQQADTADATGSVSIEGTGAATQAPNISDATGTVTGSNEVTGTGAATQAPNVSTASATVVVTGSASSVQRKNVSHASALVSGGDTPPPIRNVVLNRGRAMKWFQAGEDLTFDIDILVNGIPSQPDAGTVSYTVRDQAGQPIPGLNQQPVAVPGTTASISVPASANQLASGSESESRIVTLSFIAAGQSRQLRTSYSLHAFLPIEASCDAVRSLVGVSVDELPDDDIDLVVSYFDLVAEEGETFRSAFTATNQSRGAANRALALRAALDAVPSLQLRIFQSRQSENSSFSRFTAVDFERLKNDLRDKLAAALKSITAPSVSASIPTLFVVSSPTDSLTNS
jgi:hypothetical protein